jgi:hypothetical protein
MRNNWFVQGLITNGAWAALVLVGGVVMTILARYASPWVGPALYGLGASVLLLIATLATKAINRLPRKRSIVGTDNVESHVRAWLDNFRTTVKNDPIDEALFRFTVTMDGGAKLLVGRLRGDLNGYIVVRGEVTPSEEERRYLEVLPAEVLMRMRDEIRLELARAKVGYSGIKIPLENFAIFKRIPINDALTEDSFIAKLEEVEAALNAVGAICAIGLREGATRTATASALQPASPQ